MRAPQLALVDGDERLVLAQRLLGLDGQRQWEELGDGAPQKNASLSIKPKNESKPSLA